METYTNFLQTFLLLECRHIYPADNFVFMPSHRAKATRNFPRSVVSDFVSVAEWEPHAPDLNPWDCSVWDILQNLCTRSDVNRINYANLHKLEKAIRQISNEIDHQTIKRLFCSGKGVQQQSQNRMRTNSAVSTTSVRRLLKLLITD